MCLSVVGRPGRSAYPRMKPKNRRINSERYATAAAVADGKVYSNEYWIKRAIMSKYDRNTIPVRRDDVPIPLHVGMSLYHILDTVIAPLLIAITTIVQPTRIQNTAHNRMPYVLAYDDNWHTD